MDLQLKRGLLDACVLSVLARGDSYGYKMVRDMTGRVEISESTLYPILKRLEAAGCLTVYSVEHNGRLRRFYSITERGRIRLNEFMKDWQEVVSAYNFIKEGCENE
ncbi:MAG: PadR family transcriptional regulator [Oscillospiraceae bacterium]|nr:PadR family transcriptional regulator [Oscillospiraceae bacterium]